MAPRIRPIFLLAAVFLFVALPVLSAQIHGVPASVTSFGFGGSTSLSPGVAASVTSLGPNGFGNRATIFGNCCFNRSLRMNVPPGFHMRRHFHNAFFPGGVPGFSLPYTPVILVQPDMVADTDEDYEGGPTIFDRRGSHANRPRERALEPEPAPQSAAPVDSEPVVPQPSTVLVFKDGHQSEIQNYAIVGNTLFDLTDNRSRKIMLADLDLPATRKANDANGVDFQVPPDSAR
jgi:hypothetical protein